MNKMYKDTKTWNVIKGCLFDCIYCEPSFKRQAKRQKHNCIDCYNYKPHFHPERLKQQLPKDKLIFCCGNGDIAFAKKEWITQLLDEIRDNRQEYTFLLQSKKPSCLNDFDIPDNCIVGTTIETNRETQHISKAPSTKIRIHELKQIPHKRKFVTHEPILKFDLYTITNWDKSINPEIIWIGYANHTNNLKLDEPSLEKTNQLINELNKFTEVRLKTIRDKLR